MKSIIKAIVLDLDGVYYKKGGLYPFVKWLMDLTGKSDEELREIFHANKVFKQFQIGTVTEDDYWNYVQDRLGMEIDHKEYMSRLAKGFEIDTDLINYILELRNKYKIKFGICSNTNISTTRSRIINGVEPKDYDFQILSYEVGIKKPDKRIFEIVVSKAECSPNEIIYLDDDANKLPEAKEMGINTYVYENLSDFKKFLSEFDF